MQSFRTSVLQGREHFSKKYELTDEHRAQLKPWADRWIANAMSTEPMTQADREACVDAVRNMYAAAKLDAPRVVFVSSPFIAAFASGFAAGIWHLRSSGVATWAATESATWAATSAATSAATDAATRDATRDATMAATDAATMAATRDATKDATWAATSAATAATESATSAATAAATWAATTAATMAATAATESASRDATMAATRDATRAATRAATSAATDAATSAATWAATMVATWEATRDATKDATAATRDATWAATWGATRDATDATRDATDAATWDATWAATWDATWDATRDATAATRDATWAATRAATRAATWAATWAATADATADATWAATTAASRDATAVATKAATRDATWAATWDATDAATWAATTAATRDATRAATADAARAATWAATMAVAPNNNWYSVNIGAFKQVAELIGTTRAQFLLECAALSYRLYQGGNQWSGNDAYLSFFQDVAKLNLPAYEAYQHWRVLSERSGPRYVHEKFCIISDRPVKLLVDDRNRPHCDDGPFCQWSDGSALYAVHGVRVPAWVIERPQDITAEKIDAEDNSEVQRVMIEKFGWERYASECNAVSLDHDERWGALMYKRGTGEDLLFLVVTNRSAEPDGSFRKYVLPLHPQLRPLPDPENPDSDFGKPQKLTALNAVASTFGMTGREYERVLGAES